MPASAAAADLPPLALYVHFPWCVAKCPYCDFNSHALKDELPVDRYLAALDADLAAQSVALGARTVVSIFLGGGTPSLFPPPAIARVLEQARARLPLAEDVEITMEANPGTIERGRFAEYRGAGVNRVSLGAQSFSDDRLAALGRIHRAEETRRAAQELHAAGLANFNLDLMYALPEQSPLEAERDVEEALALAPAHLSHYQLTLEPGTVFGARPPAHLPPEEAVDEMLERCEARLAAAGLQRYEVSGYARPGARCRHNLNYWGFGDYLGIGAGAHGKLSVREDGGALSIERTVQLREPRRYLAGGALGLVRQSVAPRDRPFEFMMNALRLIDGFPREEFERRTAVAWSVVAPIMESLRSGGLAETAGSRWRPSARGLRYLNDVLLRFLPAPTPAR